MPNGKQGPRANKIVPLRKCGPLAPKRPGSISFGFDEDEGVGVIVDRDGSIERITADEEE